MDLGWKILASVLDASSAAAMARDRSDLIIVGRGGCLLTGCRL